MSELYSKLPHHFYLHSTNANFLKFQITHQLCFPNTSSGFVWIVSYLGYFLGYFLRSRKYEIGVWIASKSCKLAFGQVLIIEFKHVTLTLTLTLTSKILTLTSKILILYYVYAKPIAYLIPKRYRLI